MSTSSALNNNFDLNFSHLCDNAWSTVSLLFGLSDNSLLMNCLISLLRVHTASGGYTTVSFGFTSALLRLLAKVCGDLPTKIW